MPNQYKVLYQESYIEVSGDWLTYLILLGVFFTVYIVFHKKAHWVRVLIPILFVVSYLSVYFGGNDLAQFYKKLKHNEVEITEGVPYFLQHHQEHRHPKEIILVGGVTFMYHPSSHNNSPGYHQTCATNGVICGERTFRISYIMYDGLDRIVKIEECK
jgi:hypothetical protein